MIESNCTHSQRRRGYGYDEMMRIIRKEEYENDRTYYKDCHEYRLKDGTSDMDPELYANWARQFDYDIASGKRNYHYEDSLV